MTRGRNIVADGWALGRGVSALLIKLEVIASNAEIPYRRAYRRGRVGGGLQPSPPTHTHDARSQPRHP